MYHLNVQSKAEMMVKLLSPVITDSDILSMSFMTSF